MSLVSKLTKITCSLYEQDGDSKKCIHYQKGGSCNLPDQLMCTEWLKLNANKDTRSEEDKIRQSRMEVNIPSDNKRKEIGIESPRIVIARDADPLEPYIIPDKEIESLTELGMELRLTAEEFEEDVWIVPELTDQDRIELTYRDMANLVSIVSVFPGSKIVRVRKGKKVEK